MLLQGADKVEKEKTALLHHFVRAFQEEIIVVTSHVLDHADAHNAVKLLSQLRQITVVHKLYLHVVLKAFLFDPLLALLVLLLAQRDAGSVHLVLFRRLDQKESPAAADIQKSHPLFQVKLLQDIIDLVDLSLIKCIVLMLEVAAGVAHCLIQPQLVEVVSDIVVAPHFLLLVFLR